jgi:hypothetical protein
VGNAGGAPNRGDEYTYDVLYTEKVGAWSDCPAKCAELDNNSGEYKFTCPPNSDVNNALDALRDTIGDTGVRRREQCLGRTT